MIHGIAYASNAFKQEPQDKNIRDVCYTKPRSATPLHNRTSLSLLSAKAQTARVNSVRWSILLLALVITASDSSIDHSTAFLVMMKFSRKCGKVASTLRLVIRHTKTLFFFHNNFWHPLCSRFIARTCSVISNKHVACIRNHVFCTLKAVLLMASTFINVKTVVFFDVSRDLAKAKEHR